MKKTQKEINDLIKKLDEKTINRAKRSLTTRIKKQCVEMGLGCVKNQLEFLKSNKTILPDDRLGMTHTIQCFERGIEQYIKNYTTGVV